MPDFVQPGGGNPTSPEGHPSNPARIVNDELYDKVNHLGGMSNVPERDAVHPGDTCPTCSRRVPLPKKVSSPTSKPIAYRAPLDEYEVHLEVIDAVADLLGVKTEPYHRFKSISYACAAVLQQGLRVDG